MSDFPLFPISEFSFSYFCHRYFRFTDVSFLYYVCLCLFLCLCSVNLCVNGCVRMCVWECECVCVSVAKCVWMGFIYFFESVIFPECLRVCINQWMSLWFSTNLNKRRHEIISLQTGIITSAHTDIQTHSHTKTETHTKQIDRNTHSYKLRKLQSHMVTHTLTHPPRLRPARKTGTHIRRDAFWNFYELFHIETILSKARFLLISFHIFSYSYPSSTLIL